MSGQGKLVFKSGAKQEGIFENGSRSFFKTFVNRLGN
jgi:hypothetical protein